MMKSFLLAAAAVAAISCAKELAPEVNETPAPEVELVPMTFNASSEVETKVAHDGNGLVWQDGDKIAVISGTTFSEFTATDIDGSTATFTGWTTEAANHYAVYPASAVKEVTAEGVFDVVIPAVQTAVHGSFDPSALVAVTKADDENNLMFMNIVTMVKFRLSNPENVKSVRFTAVNNNGQEATLASLGTIKAETNITGHSYKSGESKMITLNAPADGFKADTDYYIVFRTNDCRKGFTFYFEYNNGTVKKRSTVNPLFGENKTSGFRNQVRNLKTIDVNLTDLTPYDSYQMGFDLAVAGKTINKATYGDATLITKTQGIEKSGVYFVNSDATANFNSGITGNLIVIGNNPGARSNVSRSGVSYLTASESDDALIMQNVKYVECTANVFQLNAGVPFETITFDNCLFSIPTGKFFLLSNSAANTITDFTMVNCDVKMDGAVSLVKMGASTINSITFENNVLYSDTEMTSFLAVNSTAKVESVVFNNNTLYNTTIGSSTSNEDAIVIASNITDFVAKNNYVVYANYTNNRYFGRATFVGGEIDNNFYVRKSGTTTAIYGVPGTKPAWVTNQPAPKGAPETLTTNWDPENGKYILGGYNGVGATR